MSFASRSGPRFPVSGPDLLAETLGHLRVLVGFDTRNPPRAIGTDGIFEYLRAQLPGFDVRVSDHGAGAVSLFAVRGEPKLLFNVHLDTVPDSPRWSASPFELRVTDDRAIGLGACDIKGAAAALLAVARACDSGMALLFTTDEEGVDPRCVRTFLDAFPPLPLGEGRGEGTREAEHFRDTEPSPRRSALDAPRRLSRGARGFQAVIVAEPTRCEAVLAHRGIQSVCARFAGRAGHSSSEQKPADSALHQAVRWANAALDFAEAQAQQGFGELRGLRFNLGRIDGGIKANVIAPDAELRIGIRPLPSMDMDELLERLRALAEPAPAEFRETFRGPPLPARPGDAEAVIAQARASATALALPIGDAVDFWTEAALFSQAGYTTFVYGPGDIAQAHSTDEWVALGQLHRYADSIHRIVAEAGA